jgi:hypothetical protein
MITAWSLLIIAVLLAPIASLAASKESDQPDKEMLRMMDVLKDWDVINNMDMIRDLQQNGPPPRQSPPKAGEGGTPLPKKEAAK